MDTHRQDRWTEPRQVNLEILVWTHLENQLGPIASRGMSIQPSVKYVEIAFISYQFEKLPVSKFQYFGKYNTALWQL